MRYFIALFLLSISTFSSGQTELLDAKKLWARDSIRLGTNWIRSISKDTALLTVTDRDIPSAKAVKDFVLNRWNNGLVPWDNIIGKPFNFPTTYSLSNDVKDSIQSRVRGSSASGQVTYWNGTNSVTGSSSFTWNNSLLRMGIRNSASPLAPIHVGNRNVNNSSDAQILISREIDNTISGNGHGFSDASNLNRSGTISYNSFDGRIDISGSNNYGHYVAFQHGPVNNSTGTIDEVSGLTTILTTNSGIVDKNYGALILNPAGTGTINKNYGIFVAPMTRGAENYAFYSLVADGTNRWNVYSGGTAPNYFAGFVGIGAVSSTNSNFLINRNVTGSSFAYSVRNIATIQSDVTNSSAGFLNQLNTANSAFTILNYRHYHANQSSIGASNTVTNQVGFFADETMIGGTNDYGFFGNIPSGNRQWNSYMNGTARNFFRGITHIGDTITYAGSANLSVTGKAYVSDSINAGSIKRIGGTSSQYLMADGSVSTLTNPVTGTGSSGQIAYWNGTSTQTGSNNLFWDASNSKLALGTTTTTSATRFILQGTTESDGGQYGAELLSGTGWTSTDWAGSFASGWTHTTGNTTALSNTLAAVNNTRYHISYTVTGRTAGLFTISFGGVTSGNLSASGNLGIRAVSTGNLVITPTSTFDGTIVISVKALSVSTATASMLSSAGVVTNELRASAITTNTFLGLSTGLFNTTGFRNTFIGSNAGFNNISGNNNSFFGSSAGINNTSGGSNTFSGASSGASNTTGSNNSFYGANSGTLNTTGNNNSFFGLSAGAANTTGSSNTFGGVSSGAANTTGSSNSFYGTSAGSLNTTGATNSFFGASAGVTNTTGSGNTFIGSSAGFGNTTGINNTFLGTGSGTSNTTGSGNNFIGVNAGFNNTTGNNNLFSGNNAGRFLLDGTTAHTSSDSSIFIGVGTRSFADAQTNQIVIGNRALGNGSNTVTIGNSSITNNYLFGNVRAGAFIITGGTSSQYLMADGSVTSVTSPNNDLYLSVQSLSGSLSSWKMVNINTSTSGSLGWRLPAASSNIGRVIEVINKGNNPSFYIDTAGEGILYLSGGTVQSTTSIGLQYGRLISDGTNWYLVTQW